MNRQLWMIVRVGVGCLVALAACARADAPAPSASEEAGRHKILPHQKVDRAPGSTSVGNGGWWGGPVLVSIALIALGVASVAAKKWLPGAVGEGPAPLKVIGRTALTPRHSVHIVKAGDRVLLIGTGPQGAPSLLGELDEPEPSPAPTAAKPATAANSPPRLLHRVSRLTGAAS